MRQHVAERPELADLQLAGAHRLDFGVVVGGDEDLDLAAEFLAEQLADVVVDRHQFGGGVERFDAEAHDAVIGAIGRGERRHGQRGRGQSKRDHGRK